MADGVDGSAGTDRATRAAHEIFLLSLLGGDDGPLIDDDLASVIAELVDVMTDVRFESGEFLYREGEPSRDYFFISSGEVEINGPALTRILRDRAVVGAIDAINDRAHASSAVAVTVVRALKLPIRAWLEALEDSFELVQIILGNMARNGHALKTRPALAAHDEPESIPSGESLSSDRMNLVEKILALRKADPFRRSALQATTTLANLAEEVRLDLGDALFRKGQLQRYLYVVASGTVRTIHGATGIRQTTNAGFVINPAATFANALDDYEIVATRPSVVLKLSIDDVFDVMEEHFEFVRSTMMMLSTDFEKDLIAGGGHNPGGRDVS